MTITYLNECYSRDVVTLDVQRLQRRKTLSNKEERGTNVCRSIETVDDLGWTVDWMGIVDESKSKVKAKRDNKYW